MKKKWLVVCIVLLLTILATIAFAGNPVKLFVNGREGEIKGENEQEEVVRLVEDFGKKLKSVSLLAPQDREPGMQEITAVLALRFWLITEIMFRKAAFQSVVSV